MFDATTSVETTHARLKVEYTVYLASRDQVIELPIGTVFEVLGFTPRQVHGFYPMADGSKILLSVEPHEVDPVLPS